MTVKCHKFTVSTKGFDDLIDITSKVDDIVSFVEEKEVLANISVTASTASVLTLEREPGLVVDLPRLLDNIAPVNKIYQHDNLWHEGNGFAHLRAALLGNSISIPVIDGKLALNNWQQIVLIDFDNKPRIRQVVVSVVY